LLSAAIIARLLTLIDHDATLRSLLLARHSVSRAKLAKGVHHWYSAWPLGNQAMGYESDGRDGTDWSRTTASATCANNTSISNGIGTTGT
jgi:hypothetical protein